MSVKIVSEEIKRFLATSEPEVLCISGPWGAGKTYAWDHYLRSAEKVAMADYAYVSLFGQNSLQDVRNSIFENTELVKPTEAKQGTTHWKEKGERLWRQATKYRQLLSSFAPEGAIGIGERILFASIKPQIVCIDDFERAGEGLSKMDVLGLVTQLKEQKKCKVVLLLNAAALGDEELEFNRQIEKVGDTVISFEPNPYEAAKLGLSDDTPAKELVLGHCVKLEIRNIRVIKRIEKTARRLRAILKDHDKRIYHQAVHTAVLFTFARYQPDLAPSVEFIRSFNRILGGNNANANDSEWRRVLSEYDFGRVDEFDFVIADGIRRGYFDTEELIKQADALQKKLQLQDKDSSFSLAWDRYHHSFDDDQEEVLDQMAAAFERCVEAITPLNANGTAKFFKDLGRAQQSRDLVEYYVANRNEAQEFWNLDEHVFREDITDPDIVELFREKYASFQTTLEDPADILLRINKERGWGPRDVQSLAQLTVDDFYDLFKRCSGENLPRITAEALRFRGRGTPGSLEHTISVSADAALERISAESLINARRVQQHRSRA